MMTLILKSYLSLFISIGVGCLFVFVLGLYLIFRAPNKSIKSFQIPFEQYAEPRLVEEQDISEIAGDDVIATQLDLARAYIESNRKMLARVILELVVERGTADQQNEARNLLGLL